MLLSTLTSYKFASQLQDLEERILNPGVPTVEISCGAGSVHNNAAKLKSHSYYTIKCFHVSSFFSMHNYKHPYGVLTNVGPVCNQPMQDYHVANIEELVVNTNASKKILYAQLRQLSIESWAGAPGGQSAAMRS